MSATVAPHEHSGKVPRGSDPWAALRDHSAIRELVDRLTLPSLEEWSPKRARDGLFITWIEQQEGLGRRANRKRLPPRPSPQLRGSRMEFSATAIAKYERAVLKDPAYGPDRREFYAWLNRFEEDWPAPLTFTPPRYGGPAGDPIPWGGRRQRLYGPDRAGLLNRAFVAVQAEHPLWKARATWDELAVIVAERTGPTLTGSQLADLARPPKQRRASGRNARQP